VAATETLPPKLAGFRARIASIHGNPHRCKVAHSGVILLVWPFVWTSFIFFVPAGHATDLKPATSAAFDHYIAATESQMDASLDLFLEVDRLAEPQRQGAYDQLRHGEVHILEMRTKENGRPIPIPNGLVHHWAGAIFIPQATLSDVLAVLDDYSNQANIYKSDVRESKLLDQSGDDAKIFEQFYSKTIVTVILNAYFDVTQTRIGSTRSQTVSRSTRIVEVEDPGTDEAEPAEGKDHGYMWRLNSYWRVEEKDGGVYVQNESISLSRTVPVLLAWLIEPFTKSIPRDVLTRTLTHTREAIEANRAKWKKESPPEKISPGRESSPR
jgi:hypothetical protein